MSSDRTFGKAPDVRKRTTKVNIWMVIGVMVFFAIGAAGIYWLWKNTAA